MRVLLVNPPPHQRVDQFDTPDFTRLGLACLAAQLRLDAAVTVEILDAKFERLSHEEVQQRVGRFAPDVVGITAFTNEIRPASLVARSVKALSGSIVTVVGGVHVSALPRETLGEFPEFDYGAVGEGELTFDELVHALARSAPIAGVAGLVRRTALGPQLTAPRPAPSDLDALPMPAWDLLPRGERHLFMSQRGCPYGCNFCQNPNGRLVRQRSIHRVMEELTLIVDRHRPREITFCDEIFTVDQERTHRLLDAMIAAGIGRKVRWWAQTHVNVVDRELFRKMKAAGCFRCGLGIEAGDEGVLSAMRKGLSRERVGAVRRMASEAGLPVEGLFIIGHPDETWQTAMRTVDFAAELNPDVPVFGLMVPYPGTRVAELARRGEGGYRLISNDWNDYAKQIGHALELEHLTRRQLELLQTIGYLKVFLANRRFTELAKFVWQYRSEGLAVAKKLLFGLRPRAVAGDDVPRVASPRCSGVRPTDG